MTVIQDTFYLVIDILQQSIDKDLTEQTLLLLDLSLRGVSIDGLGQQLLLVLWSLRDIIPK